MKATCTHSPERYVVTTLHHRIEHWLLHGRPSILLLYGPSGCGKTITARQVLDSQSETFSNVWIPATWESSLEGMLGVWELHGNETHFTPGDLLVGLTTPNCVVVIDDAHTVASQLQLLNGVGDGTRQVTCPTIGQRVNVEDGVRLILIANPPSLDSPPWERARWEIPEQIRDRARMIELSSGLSRDEEESIALAYWPDEHPTEVLDGLLDVVRNLRSANLLTSYSPSVRSLVMVCDLLGQGLALGDAYLESVANKFLRADERAVAIEVFRAKFGADPTDDSSTVVEKQDET